jgi:transcription termination factor Rho
MIERKQKGGPVEADIVHGHVTLHPDGKGPIGYAELHTDIPIQGLSVFYIQPGLVRRFFIREDDRLSAHVQSPRGWLTHWHIRQLITINGQDPEAVRRERQSGAT